MKRILLLITLAAFAGLTASAQGQPLFDAHNLSIAWQAIRNDSPKKGESVNAITITNNGNATLPAKGWKMYFNSARLILPDAVTGNAEIKFVNGDLFCLTPSGSFKALKPGQSERIDFVDEDEVVNITDGPEGFYLVWDKQPDKGYNTGKFSILPFKPVYSGLVTTATVYEQNRIIKDVPEDRLTKIFPTPASYVETGGALTVTSSVAVSADPQFANEAAQLNDFLDMVFGKRETAQPVITIKLLYKNGLPEEGYELSVKPDGITLSASEPAGMFYGIQSLKTLTPPAAFAHPQKEIAFPCVEVKDEPRFAFRGFMLDVGRNFKPKSEIFRILDVMSLYKLNVFHMHLTEDEGWRLQIPGLPELTKVGARRAHTLDTKNFLPPSHGSGGDFSNPNGSGYYTVADFVDILKYAKKLHIMVEPEIEAPGHARAAVKSMNARYARLMAEGKKTEAEQYLLQAPGDKSVYSTAQYWTDNVIDVSLPSTYNFVRTVTDAIIKMYKTADAPLKTINWGGDEVPAGVWEKSPAYLKLKAENPNIKSTADLWYYFYGKVNQMMRERGLYLSGWEEMAMRKTELDGKPFYVPNPDFMPYHPQAEVWNNAIGGGNEDMAYKLANAGYKTVLTCVSNLYFDMANYKSFDEPGYYWGAFVDIDKPFSFIPFDYFKNTKVDRDGMPLNRSIFIGKQRLTDYGKTNIYGLECALWGENIKSINRLEYMLLPRMLGFAERAWAPNPDWATEPKEIRSDSLYNIAWVNFLNVLGKRELPRLTYFDGGFNYRIPKPGVMLQDGKYYVNEQFPGFTIRYTTDGTEPDASSPVYNDAVTNAGNKLKFRAFDTKGRGSHVSEPVTP